MAEPSIFRNYQIVQDAGGNNVELHRNQEQVAVLAFDRDRFEFTNCHVLLQPLDNRTNFESACKTLQRDGHPLFARMLDFGEDDGNPFYITSTVDGETLGAYLNRQTDIPVWLAVMIAGRGLDSAIALAERGDFLLDNALDAFRVCQVGISSLQVLVSDYRVVERTGKNKGRLVKANFERQANFLRAFLQEKSGGASGPTLPESPVPSVDFAELLGAVLGSGGPGLIEAMAEVRAALRKLVPDHLAGEVPTPHKPRSLLAPLLASYQDVARAVVNVVRIQSQRLDMANPYAMKGTLTRAGRQVTVEEVPGAHLAGRSVLDFLLAAQKLGRKREVTALLSVPLVNEVKAGITCMAEDTVDGITVTELLAERRSLQVNEAYLVLAGLDAALAQLETSRLNTRKLRLEDIILLTGFAKEDTRSARLLGAKLTEWPSFKIMLRAHPTLAAMAGRGTDPAVLLPPALPGATNIWHGGWLASVAKFLLDSPADSSQNHELEGITNLLNEEIAKARDGSPANRADFLSRYARVIQHYDLVQAVPITIIAPAQSSKKSVGKAPLRTLGAGSQTQGKKGDPLAKVPAVVSTPSAPIVPLAQPAPVAEAPPPAEESPARPSAPLAFANPIGAALMGGLPTGEAEKRPTIGFAELLFQGGATGAGDESSPAPTLWGGGASAGMESGHVGDWADGPDENIPIWLKAAVFLGGSMVAGAGLAHLTGQALWQQEMPHNTPPPAVTPAVPPAKPAPKPGIPMITPGVPKRPS